MRTVLWMRTVINAAAESDEEIVDPMKDRTRSKSSKVIVPEAVICADTEDKPPRPQPRKRDRAGPAPLRAGGQAKYFLRNSNRFPSIASRKRTACKGQTGGRGRK